MILKSCFCTLSGLMLIVSMGDAALSASADHDTLEIATISRSIEVSERGFTHGWSFSKLIGEAEVYFPVSKALRSSELVLEIAQNKVSDSDRSIRVFVGDVVLFAMDPERLGTRDQLRIPIDPALADGDFLRVRIQYSGASSDNVCVDERASGDFFRILPSSRLLMEIDESAIDRAEDVLRLQPSPTTILLPDDVQSSNETLAAALRAATIFGAYRGDTEFRDEVGEYGKFWANGVLSISEASANSEAHSTLQAKQLGGVPGIEISGHDPQDALDLLTGDWSRVASRDLISVKKILHHQNADDGLSFSRLGFDLNPFMSKGSSLQDFNFDIASIPAGQRIESVSLLYSMAQDVRIEGATLAIYINDTLIGSESITDGELNWFDAVVPEGLIARDNRLHVQILRPVVEGKCLDTILPLPGQIHGSSHFNLSPKSEKIVDFHDLRQQMQTVVDVMFASSDAFDVREISSIAPIFSSVIPPSARIQLVQEIVPEAAIPFVYISESPPAGSNPALVFDQGDVSLTTSEGELVLAGGSIDALTSAQIVSVEDREGLWIRPAVGFQMQPSRYRPVILDQGNVALLDAEGVVVVTSTERSDLIDIRYDERRDILAIIEHYRLWLIGIAWIAITIVALEALRRTFAAQCE